MSAAEKLEPFPFAVRDGKYSDRGFVRDSWTKANAHSAQARYYGAGYYKKHRSQTTGILDDPDTRVIVACSVEDEDAIYGWSVSRGNVLFYRYVRGDMRRQGIGQALIPPGIEAYAQQRARGNQPKAWRYEPERMDK